MMHRVANPPKLPVLGDPVSQSRGGTKVRSGTAAAVMLALTMAFPGLLAGNLAHADGPPTSASSAFTASAAGGTPAPVTAPNFVVVGVAPERADEIAAHAETMRLQAFATLLGQEHPRPWAVRCEIRVHASAEAFAAALGGPPVDARGATSIEFLGADVVRRRIDVLDDGGESIPDACDHELVHVVLADHFVAGPPPRWADEGLALLFDAPAKQRSHEADFLAARRQGLAWSAEELVAMEDYPTDSRRQQVFYGQSAALVRWLVARRDAATFIRFLDDEALIGIAAALARHYDLSLDSVASAWKEVAPINTLGSADRRP
jgi:hypothetical protein